jgi:hypothetical protein
VPFTQYAPLPHGAVLLRVSGEGPRVYSPGFATTGALEPAGQYLGCKKGKTGNQASRQAETHNKGEASTKQY